MASHTKHLASLAAITLVLAACGAATPPATTAGPAPTTTAGPAPTTTTEPAPTTTTPTATTTTPATTTPATTTPATTTSTAGPTCTPLGPIPPTADGQTVYISDLSGDGSADTVTTYRDDPAGYWYMRVEFGEGGGSVHQLIESFDPQGSRVLGSHDVEGNATPEIFVKDGGGAYAQNIILFDVTGCTVTPTSVNGSQAGFLVGASISNITGLMCEAGGITTLFAEIQGDGPNYEGGFAPFSLAGSVFTAEFGDGAGFTADEAFELAVLDCPGVDL